MFKACYFTLFYFIYIHITEAVTNQINSKASVKSQYIFIFQIFVATQ